MDRQTIPALPAPSMTLPHLDGIHLHEVRGVLALSSLDCFEQSLVAVAGNGLPCHLGAEELHHLLLQDGAEGGGGGGERREGREGGQRVIHHCIAACPKVARRRRCVQTHPQGKSPVASQSSSQPRSSLVRSRLSVSCLTS